MFQKPAFGGNTSGFGSFNAGASTSFGGFKSTTGSGAFGAPPAFGATAAPNTNTGGGLFGGTSTTGGLFGSTNTSAAGPAFGASTTGFGFGASTPGTGLFTSNTSGGLFGANQNTSAFGAKPAGFGFGSTPATGAAGGLFGAPAASSGLFGQTQTNAMTGGGLFSNTGGGFGQQQATGTAHAKYNPVVGTDVVVKSGNSQSINIKHHCITCMKEYESKSLEELRLEDYTAGRKGAAAGVFTGFNAQEAKPLFGGGTFSQPATTSAPSVFGGTVGGGFGQTNTFSFGGGTAQNQTNTTNLFGASKPAFGATPAAAPSLFGTATTQASTFGTPTSTFGFGASTQNQIPITGIHNICSATQKMGLPLPAVDKLIKIPTKIYSINSIAQIWAEKLEQLHPEQKFFAEKAINDILFEAALGNLDGSSVKINYDTCLSSLKSDRSVASSTPWSRYSTSPFSRYSHGISSTNAADEQASLSKARHNSELASLPSSSDESTRQSPVFSTPASTPLPTFPSLAIDPQSSPVASKSKLNEKPTSLTSIKSLTDHPESSFSPIDLALKELNPLKQIFSSLSSSKDSSSIFKSIHSSDDTALKQNVESVPSLISKASPLTRASILGFSSSPKKSNTPELKRVTPPSRKPSIPDSSSSSES